MELEPTLIAVFLTGLLGGVHCAGMCGGIVGAIGLLGERSADPSALVRTRAPTAVGRSGASPAAASSGTAPRVAVAVPVAMPRPSAVPRPSSGSTRRSSAARHLARLLPYNAGRLASYTALGTAAGAVGSFGWLLGEALPLQQWAFASTSVLLILMGLYVAGLRRIGHAFESLGRGPWARIRPLATASLARADSSAGAFVTGALWGLVPCGMVYAVLAGALLGGSAAHGAALMLAFGLGTLPNLMLLGASGSLLIRLTRRPYLRPAFGLAIAAFGVLGLLRLDVAASLPIFGDLCAQLPLGGR